MQKAESRMQKEESRRQNPEGGGQKAGGVISVFCRPLDKS